MAVINDEFPKVLATDDADPPDSDALKSHIYALRKQLELAGARNMIVTIPQLGYRLQLEEADRV